MGGELRLFQIDDFVQRPPASDRLRAFHDHHDTVQRRNDEETRATTPFMVAREEARRAAELEQQRMTKSKIENGLAFVALTQELNLGSFL